MVLVDRVKDVVRLANGETLSPQEIESMLRFSPYIKDPWILAGPEAQYASAIIVIDYNSVESGPERGGCLTALSQNSLNGLRFTNS